ncbi:MAG: hydrogenase iron-sulfur subunit [Terriglobia bacterium]|nr:hydrogenase iron-sulfur subunit [Terriglobia bacterium]
MNKRVGVYVCTGCSIGEALDVESLKSVAMKECKAELCRTHEFLCGDEGTAQIRQDIEGAGIDAVVIAGCSSRAKTQQFNFNGAVVSDRVNLREQVAWCHVPKDEETQALAEDSLRMGVSKVRHMEPLEPLADPVSHTLLVVGGGITGITAALDAANAGCDVLLVEKQRCLGGALAGIKKTYPMHAPFTEAVPSPLPERIAAVMSHPRVKVFCSTTIVRTEGQPGAFDVTLQNGASSAVHRVGAIVMATGWKPYDAKKLGALGYGVADVVTSVELESLGAAGPIKRVSDGKPVESILFVQCAGSRDAQHLAYCSSTCCMTTLKQVEYIREQNPTANVFVIYKDVTTPGRYEEYYQKVQNHPLNFFTKGEVKGVARGGDGKLSVTVTDSPLGKSISIPVDMVVLATGMVPNSADGEAIRALHDAQQKVARNESETQRREAELTVEQLKRHEGTEILRLTYRQGPDLPVRNGGFPSSHFICFPYETRRTGIFTAGAVRAPMDMVRAEEDAAGAVMKAIQSVHMASQGQALHPRAGDLSYPVFSLQRCTQCKRCTEECPFGSLDEDEKGTPKFNAYRCRRCGICMGACPERIVSFKNYSVEMIASMVKAIEVPEEDEEKPRIVIFACENDACPVLDQVGMERLQYDASVRIIPLRCLGSMNIVWIADALSRGVDGILLLGCKFGDDYQCHFVRGSELANRRLENVKETLQRLQLESERIQLVQVSADDYLTLPDTINQFVAKVRDLGPNPYKGF